MRLSEDAIIALCLIGVVIASIALSMRERVSDRIEFKILHNLRNDLNSDVMLSLNYVPENVSRVSSLLYYKTRIALFNEKIIIAFKEPTKVLFIERSPVYMNVEAYVIYARRSPDGYYCILLEPKVGKDVKILMITLAIYNESRVDVINIGLAVNQSEVVQIEGVVQVNGEGIANKLIKVMAYEVKEGNVTPRLSDFLEKGITIDEVISDNNGRFRVRVLSPYLPEKAYIAVIASTKEKGYIILKNKAGTELSNIVLRG